MASLAERLPVRLIPEQPLVAPVRDDVIHHCCRHDLTLRKAEGAQRMLLQEKSAGFTPAGIIPSGVGSAALAVSAPHGMIFTEHLTLFAESGAPRVAAGSFRFKRHVFSPPVR